MTIKASITMHNKTNHRTKQINQQGGIKTHFYITIFINNRQFTVNSVRNMCGYCVKRGYQKNHVVDAKKVDHLWLPGS